MAGSCFAEDTVAMEGSFQGNDRSKVDTGIGEDFAESGWSAEVDRFF